jgi:glutamate-1-semialdehyde 2,1-aminomutase
MGRYDQSAALYERACRVLAGGISSEFRRNSYPHPLFFTHGSGSRVYDADGNEYLDFTLSQGPLILGHSHPEVLDAVARASEAGQLFAGQHLAELELAETIQRLVPCAELLRFSLDGSEAVHAALRLARATTGRPRFLRFEGHYHGWLDNVAFGVSAATMDALGPREQPTPQPWTQGLPLRVMDEALVLPWNDLALVERVLAERHDEIAAVITEPVMCNSGCIPPAPGFLAGLRSLSDRYGIVLIFDEVITGFRLDLGGAQAYYGVIPDLAVFAKAIGNGYPISALAGTAAAMRLLADGSVVHAGTLNGGNPTIAAALATIAVLEREQVHVRLLALGQQLMSGLRAAAHETGHQVLIQGPGPMFHMGFTTLAQVNDYRDTLSYDRALYAAFLREMQARGIRLIGRGLWYLSAAHTPQEIDHTVEMAYSVFQNLPVYDPAKS